VVSGAAVDRVPSAFEPVSMSCFVGPIIMPFSVSAVA